MLTLVCRTGALNDAPHAVGGAVGAQLASEHGAMPADNTSSHHATPPLLDVSASGTYGMFTLLFLVDCMICHLVFCWFSAVIQME